MKQPLPLFPNVERTNKRKQSAGESTYQFLQRVDDPAFARVRTVFNEWVDRFAGVQAPEATNDLKKLRRIADRRVTHLVRLGRELLEENEEHVAPRAPAGQRLRSHSRALAAVPELVSFRRTPS